MRHVFALFTCASLLGFSGCSGSSGRQSKTYSTGEKASADDMTYAVVDTEIHTRLGDDPANPRVPQTRFLTVLISVTNGTNADIPIPTLTLVDDAGKTYTELADGSGVPRWLGVVRKVGPGDTEQGNVVFDAPAAHYKLKLTDETSPADVYVDIPLSFVHEQMNDVAAPVENAQPEMQPPPRKQ